jgi:hypothetical protein
MCRRAFGGWEISGSHFSRSEAVSNLKFIFKGAL